MQFEPPNKDRGNGSFRGNSPSHCIPKKHLGAIDANGVAAVTLVFVGQSASTSRGRAVQRIEELECDLLPMVLGMVLGMMLAMGLGMVLGMGMYVVVDDAVMGPPTDLDEGGGGDFEYVLALLLSLDEEDTLELGLVAVGGE